MPGNLVERGLFANPYDEAAPGGPPTELVAAGDDGVAKAVTHVYASGDDGVPQLVWALDAEHPNGATRAWVAGGEVNVTFTVPAAPPVADSFVVRRYDGGVVEVVPVTSGSTTASFSFYAIDKTPSQAPGAVTTATRAATVPRGGAPAMSSAGPPSVSPTSAAMVEFRGGDQFSGGLAIYADGSAFDGFGWQVGQPAREATTTHWTVAGYLGGVAAPGNATATSTLDILAPPTSVLTVYDQPSRSLYLTWNHPSYGRPKAYFIFRNGAQVVTLPGTTLQWQDTSPAAGLLNNYAVVAGNAEMPLFMGQQHIHRMVHPRGIGTLGITRQAWTRNGPPGTDTDMITGYWQAKPSGYFDHYEFDWRSASDPNAVLTAAWTPFPDYPPNRLEAFGGVSVEGPRASYFQLRGRTASVRTAPPDNGEWVSEWSTSAILGPI